MHTQFYVKTEQLAETKQAILELPTARFVYKPLKERNKYRISLELSVEDCNKLSKLLNRYYDEEHPTIIPRKSWLERFIAWLEK